VLRTAHEPYPHELVGVLLDFNAGVWDNDRLTEFLATRDASLRLELESSHLLALLSHRLPDVFPDARYIVMVRDPYPWLRSQIAHELRLRRERRNSFWFDVFELYFRSSGFDHGPGEELLAEAELAPLDGYLAFWAATYRRLLDDLPPSSRMLVEVDDLGASLPAVASFLGVAEPAPLRAFRLNASTPEPTLAAVPRRLIEEKIDHHCGEVLSRLRPL
jgi:hypothetical protein